MESDGSFLHPAHEHSLIRRALPEGCRVECVLCGLWCSGSTYCCVGCRFFLHEPCASIEMPTHIQQHPSHPQHPLTLEVSRNRCSYVCSSCGFSRDVITAISTLPPADHLETAEEIPEILQHLGHQHPLTSFQAKGTLSSDCLICDKVIQQGAFYGCKVCLFVVHEECAKVPMEIPQHPFHPQHPLTFVMSEDDFTCEAEGSSYCCSICGIKFHVECVAWTVASEDHKLEMTHFCHKINLASCHLKLGRSKLRCEVCMRRLSGEVRCCFECRLFLHKSCLEEKLPLEIFDHPLHPEHPLVLQPKDKCGRDERFPLKCSPCEKHKFNMMYCCESCNFVIDTRCALRTLSDLKEAGIAAEIHHPADKHALALRSYAPSTTKCMACNLDLHGYFYCCKLCKFNIHRSCADLPLELKHPFHPLHPLLLNMAPTKDLHCSLCKEKINGFSFECTKCNFYFDVECATRKLAFKHHRHEHFLCHLQIFKSDYLLCNSCGTSVDFGDKIYRCLPCNFNLHDYCLLDLSSTIQHECHKYHPLLLFDKFVDLSPDDLYCDKCEEIRDPDHGVYRCEECYYTVHIDCVIPPKLSHNPLLVDMRKRVSSLKTKIEETKSKIEAMQMDLKASVQELEVLEEKIDIEEQMEWKIACDLDPKGNVEDEDKGEDNDGEAS